MSELQSTIEFSVELYKFYNVDLFQRGMYQVRCALRVQSKLSVEVEVATPDATAGLGSALVLGNYGACRPFQILYRNEEVSLKDVVLFRCHMLVDANNLRESLERAEFSLVLELWFSDSSPANMALVSSRTLQLNMSPIEGLHYHLPVLFDYFHLSSVSLTIHAALTALHQPSMKRGLLRYMQSCAPKTSKSWSKIRSAHCASLTDPVLPVSSHKVYSRINESPQVHLEAYNVLLDSSNNLKTTIKEYKLLLLQREEVVSDNYDTLVVKHNEYDSTKFLKKRSVVPTSSLAELCADNIRLWNYFLLTFSCKIAIQQFLSKKHHSLRVRRFAELFFLIYNPRRSAIGCYETNYQNYLVVAELARRSKYMQMLPPLPVHCMALDGESATMPVIFEDQYQDPFDHDKTSSDKLPLNSKDLWIFKRPKTADDKNSCSCGAKMVYDHKKSSQKTLVNEDFFSENPLSYTIPTRHSKSLDHLTMCSTNNFHFSTHAFQSKRSYTPSDKGRFKIETLKNVSSEHNMRVHKKYLVDYDFSEECSCSVGYNSLETNQKTKKSNEKSFTLNSRDQKANSAKKSNKQQYQNSIVKSQSHTSSDNIQNMFRSSSVQSFSPREKIPNGVMKFNSMLSKRSQNRKSENLHTIANGANKSTTARANGFVNNEKPKNVSKKHKKKRNVKTFEIGSTSSSTESLSYDNLNTGLSRYASSPRRGLRRARSASSLADAAKAPAPLSGATESLPNIAAAADERLSFPRTRYYSTSSSTASEQSGWITSRSSSPASSTDVAVNILEGGGRAGRGDKAAAKGDIPSFKGCDLDEMAALPPPKQFRDLEEAAGSGTTTPTPSTAENDAPADAEEEINAVDNPLYHVVDTRTTLETRPSEFPLRAASDVGDHDEFSAYRTNAEPLKAFLKAKKEFKSQLNFPGVLYSDLNSFASTIPYFHISDEFRIFSPEGMHLVVCVHGLDGNSADLRLVKTYLEMGLPGAYLDFLMSERNQGDTFSDFETMTDRLVSEILHYLDAGAGGGGHGPGMGVGGGGRPARVSFVGHSLGTVIIRSALARPQLRFLLPRLHTFLSLSGPHLGTLYNSSGLVNMGMWFMQKWKKSGSLLQLCLKDAADPRQSFLYRLSQRSTLHHFKNILLCGSGQDRYVPLHSARIELCKEALKDTTDLGAIYREMVHNIMSPIVAKKELKLLRYDVHHALPNTANALIGRAAHIAVLDSEIFIEKFMVVVGIKYFR